MATLTGAGQILGWICAVTFIWVLLASGSAWIIGAGRAQAAACLDGGGPGRSAASRRGRGCRSAWRSSPGPPRWSRSWPASTSRGATTRSTSPPRCTAAIAFIVLAYLLIYPAFLVLRLRRPHLPRPFRAPGGRVGAIAITVLATGWSLIAAACLLWPGLGTAHPDAALPEGFQGQRAQFEALVLVPVLLVVAAGAAYRLAAGRRTAAGGPPARPVPLG